jgi:putative ABC transport system permease protein
MNRIPGVVEAEAHLVLPVELEYQGNTKKLSVYGLDKDAKLFNVLDTGGNRHQLDGGIMLNRFRADELGVSEGQTVVMYSPQIRKAVHVEVAEVIEETYGVGAYMDLSELSMLLGSENISNMLLINVKDDLSHDVQTKITESNNVLWYNDNSSGLESLKESTQATEGTFMIMIIMSIIMCFAVIYNTSSISLGEKRREFATLRIIGYQLSDVSELNTFEYILMLIIGSVIGTVIAFVATPPLSAAFNTEEMMLSAKITLQSTLLAFVSCTIAVAISCVLIKRQIKKFSLADLMKERE